jgi:hypothetical protein
VIQTPTPGGGRGVTGGTNALGIGAGGTVNVRGEQQDLITHSSSSAFISKGSQHASSASSIPALAPSVFPDVPSGAWYSSAVHEAVQKGWMNTMHGKFLPDGTVTAQDVAAALRVLGINTTALQTLPRDGSWVLSKGLFLQILAEAYKTQLTERLSTKTQAEYSRVWNAIPASISHANAVRLAILAGWIAMPKGSFRGGLPLSRAEMAQILVNLVRR